jgi:GTP-binding protein
MKNKSAVFDGSAPDFQSCPPEVLPEIALVGRSNVGKSTLINTLTESSDLARVSGTPGFTRTLNFYTVDRRWKLVDMPGYGFAKTSRSERFRYSQTIEDYLLKRSCLVWVLVLVDSSIAPQATDLDFVRWIGQSGRPFAIVFTKHDKSPRGGVGTHSECFMSAVSEWFQEPPASFMTSAISRTGLRELRQAVSEVVRVASDFDGGKR